MRGGQRPVAVAGGPPYACPWHRVEVLTEELPMKRVYGPLVVAAFLACCGARDNALRGQEKDGTVVMLDGLQSRTPAAWKEEPVTDKLRYKQFRLPKVKDDKEDAVILMYRGIGGSADANLKRWKDMFLPPEGKKLDEVAKVTEIK